MQYQEYEDGKDFGFEPGFGSAGGSPRPGSNPGYPSPGPSYPGPGSSLRPGSNPGYPRPGRPGPSYPGPGPAYDEEPHLTFEMPRLELDDDNQSPYHPTFPHNEIYKPSLNEEPFAYGPEVDVVDDDDAYGPEVDVDFLEETYQDGPNEGQDLKIYCVFLNLICIVCLIKLIRKNIENN